MNTFQLFAEPWWVNLLILVPLVAYFAWRKRGLKIKSRILFASALFGIVFGFVEAAGVVYLRAATGLIPGSAAVIPSEAYQSLKLMSTLSQNLFLVEFFRETATLVMLASVAFLAAHAWRERVAVFLWVFAVWDLFYYAGLWAIVRWPSSFVTPDTLFLIPVPWISQVWFPLLVDALVVDGILFSIKTAQK